MSRLEISQDGVQSIEIRNLGGGHIELHPGDRDGLVNGHLDCPDTDHLDRSSVVQSGGRLQIELPSSAGGGPSVAITLQVPEGVGFDAGTGSADIHADVTLGMARVSTGSGDIDLAEVGDVRANTGSGDIAVQRITGGAAHLNSGSGDISVQQTAAVVQARTASGDLTVGRLTGALRANTASGDIDIPATTGSVEVRSASGSISIGIADGLAAWLELSSASGEVEIDLDASEQPAEGEPYVTVKASTASGDVTVHRA